ncbi:hypothetical protein P8918_12970 [Bacillus spizizenii]|nr:hypothetical protein [Bacillus spizizenii]MCY8890482.1 hypothetical protein [Bacillus spizizenii]MEC0841937.1 hypothetical protein [Bacillus spizizenii]
MTIEVYSKMRNNGKSLEDIQRGYSLSEGTAYTLELGYRCYLKDLPLDKAIEIIDTEGTSDENIQN